MLAPKRVWKTNTLLFTPLELSQSEHDLGNAHDDGLTEITYAGSTNRWVFFTFSINNFLSAQLHSSSFERQIPSKNKQQEILNLHGMQVTLG